MSEQVVRKCDECGALHGAVNNWWCVVASGGAPTFVRFQDAEDLELQARSEGRVMFRLDYCSHKCVGTAFHRWLDTGDVREQEVKVAAYEEAAVLV